MEQLTERVVTKITLDVTANLIETTPVDTGWARANWVPAIGTPSTSDVSGVQPTTQMATSAVAMQQQAVATVATGYRLAMGRVFVSNNVPYILALNSGSSKQAPAGLVQRAIHKAVTSDLRGLR